MLDDTVLEALQEGLDACNGMHSCCGCKIPEHFIAYIRSLGYDVDEEESNITKGPKT